MSVSNNLLLGILSLRNKIKHNGWLIFPPSFGKDNVLRVRIEWCLNGEKHGFERVLTGIELSRVKVDLAPMIIDDANREIEWILSKPQDIKK